MGIIKSSQQLTLNYWAFRAFLLQSTVNCHGRFNPKWY